jgi:hypothetical protein
MITQFKHSKSEDTLAYSFIIISEMHKARRIVLRVIDPGRKWVVQLETLGLEILTVNEGEWVHEGYIDRNCFEVRPGYDEDQAWNDAMKCFYDRAKNF